MKKQFMVKVGTKKVYFCKIENAFEKASALAVQYEKRVDVWCNGRVIGFSSSDGDIVFHGV